MAVYMNAKGSTNSSFQIGKRGNKIFGGTNTPSNGDVSTGDLWFDKGNNLVKIASVEGASVSWSNVATEGGDVSFDDLTLTGNLTVQGTTTTINTQTLNVEDNIITLNSNFSGADNVVDAGIEVERGQETNVSLLWDESEGEWTLGSEGLRAGGFTGNLFGDVTGNVQPNGGPNSVTANTITTAGTLNVTGATVSGLSTSSVSEGSNQYYTTARANSAIDSYISAGNGIVVSSGEIGVNNLGVDDFASSSFDATGDSWSNDDSTFATTAAIDDRVESLISSDTGVVHRTGNETITGNKTFNSSTVTLAANSTLDVSNATVTGANTDSISEGSNNQYFTTARADARIANNIIDEDNMSTNSATRAPSQQSVKAYVDAVDTDAVSEGSSNLYYTNPRARAALSVSDSSGQLSYNSGTGILTFTDAGASAGGSNTQVQFNDGGVIAGDSDFVFDKADNRLTVTNLTVDSNFNITSDYGTVAEAVTVTDSFGSVTSETREPTPHASYTVSEAGSITGMVAGDMIFVSDETGGATMAFYDGTNWRRVQDRAVIS